MTMSTKLTHASGVVAQECISGAMDLFSPPIMETAVDTTYFTEHLPTNTIADSANSISFHIEGSQDMCDLSESVVQVKVKITKSDDTDLDAFAAGNSVGFVQMPVTSIFSSLVFRLNDQLLSDSFSTYPYVSYFQTLLNFSGDARKSRLQLMGFYEDKDPSVTACHTAAADSGFKSRASLTEKSHQATFIGPIFHGLFSQSRWVKKNKIVASHEINVLICQLIHSFFFTFFQVPTSFGPHVIGFCQGGSQLLPQKRQGQSGLQIQNHFHETTVEKDKNLQ